MGSERTIGSSACTAHSSWSPRVQPPEWSPSGRPPSPPPPGERLAQSQARRTPACPVRARSGQERLPGMASGLCAQLPHLGKGTMTVLTSWSVLKVTWDLKGRQDSERPRGPSPPSLLALNPDTAPQLHSRPNTLPWPYVPGLPGAQPSSLPEQLLLPADPQLRKLVHLPSPRPSSLTCPAVALSVETAKGTHVDEAMGGELLGAQERPQVCGGRKGGC